MMMMVIGLDEKRISEDGYVVQPFWDWIDMVFNHVKWTKEPQPDGTVLYSSKIDNDNSFVDGYYVFQSLAQEKSFIEYCSKWIGFDNEDDETLPLIEDDYLAAVKNAL